jgi:hypothetical protein
MYFLGEMTVFVNLEKGLSRSYLEISWRGECPNIEEVACRIKTLPPLDHSQRQP